MSSPEVRIAVLGEAGSNGLSQDTLDSILRIEQLDAGCDVIIDLILLEPLEDGMSFLPCDSVFIYNQIGGSDYEAGCVKAVEHYSRHYDPSMIIVSVKKNPEIIVPKAAFKLETAGFLQCDSIDFDKTVNKFDVIKSVYGGNAAAHYSIEKAAVISFDHNSKGRAELEAKKPDVHYMDYRCSCDNKFVRKTELEYIKEQRLLDSDFIVVCGKGLGSKAAVDELCCWAETVGAAVGGTKKVIDHGWLPIQQLIGQTGHGISPELCLVIGASGAAPFINGIIGSKKIIAVNNDADARIFDYADIAIVEDAKVIMAELLEDVKEKMR